MLLYTCPTSGHRVTTSIDALESELDRMRLRSIRVSVWCPHCDWSHIVQASEMWIERSSAEKDCRAVA